MDETFDIFGLWLYIIESGLVEAVFLRIILDTKDPSRDPNDVLDNTGLNLTNILFIGMLLYRLRDSLLL